MSFQQGARHAVVTEDDIGPIIQIVTWFLLVLMVLATTLRLLIRFTTIYIPGADDALVSIAMILGVGEVITISIAVNEGLGTRATLLTITQVPKIEKSVYASTLLYIFTITFAKASTLLLIHRLANVKLHLLIVRILIGLTLMWSMAAIFGQAFQCAVPNTWELAPSRCLSIPAFWDTIGTIDILLDLALIAVPALIVWRLQMSLGRKIIIVSGFGFRAILCAAQILRLVYLHRANANGHGIGSHRQTNFIYETLGYTIATQCQTMLAVVTACVPGLKPFMDRAASGLLGVSFADRAGTYDVSGGNASYEMPSLNSNNDGGANASGKSDKSKHNSARGSGFYFRTRVTSLTPPDANNDVMIQKTVDWDVQYSDQIRLYSNPPRMNEQDDTDGGSPVETSSISPTTSSHPSHNAHTRDQI